MASFLAELPVIQDARLEEWELDRLERIAREERFDAGSAICAEGDDADRFFAVRSGKVRGFYAAFTRGLQAAYIRSAHAPHTMPGILRAPLVSWYPTSVIYHHRSLTAMATYFVPLCVIFI